MSERKLCTFIVEGSLFGVDVHFVQEVLRDQELTPVPTAPKTVRGLLNLRGQIVTAIDVRRRLGLADAVSKDCVHVVLRTSRGDTVSLVVDDVGDVIDVDVTQIEPVPETVPAKFRDHLTGIFKLEKQLLLALDVERTLAIQ